MRKTNKFGAEHTSKGRQLLKELPAKEKGKSKQELAALLGKDFRSTLEKGYTYKELSHALKACGITLSALLITANSQRKD